MALPDKIYVKGADYKRHGNMWFRTMVENVKISYIGVDDAIKILTDVRNRLEDAELEISAYDDGTIISQVTGRRLATEEEIEWILKQIEAGKAYRESAKLNEVKRFIKDHPELDVKPKER